MTRRPLLRKRSAVRPRQLAALEITRSKPALPRTYATELHRVRLEDGYAALAGFNSPTGLRKVNAWWTSATKMVLWSRDTKLAVTISPVSK
jgi:hypothetical protein